MEKEEKSKHMKAELVLSYVIRTQMYYQVVLMVESITGNMLEVKAERKLYINFFEFNINKN